ncbi:MAG: hypothetical protein ACI9C1_003666 [Candidatus Aldehydirespiratoraceae bacterium]|jgi:hypothetical protein
MTTRTSSSEMTDAAAMALGRALAAIGAEPAPHDPSATILPNGQRLSFEITAASIVDEKKAVAIVSEATQRTVVVGDLIGVDARAILEKAEVSWLDRRGHLRITQPGVWIDRDVDPLPRTRRGAGDRLELRGASALAVAVAHLLDSDEYGGVRPVARLAGLSPSAISQAQEPLVRRGILTDDADARSELFWAVSVAWRLAWIDLRVAPAPSDDIVAGGTLAAAALGAPIIATESYPLEFHVRDVGVMERLRLRAGPPQDSPEARITIAPTAFVTKVRAPNNPEIRGHRVAHPLFVALDLASDPARGAEALADWEPEGWNRAW